MPIAITCECGKKLRVKEELAGKKLRCPDCAEVVKVPRQDVDDDDYASEEEFDDLPSKSRDREERPTSLPPRIKRRPKVTKREAKPDRPAPRQHDGSGWFGNTNGGVVGGLLMIVIAVVWFVAGLAGGYIFFYPPVLLLIGIVAVIKGIFNSD